MNYLFCLLVLGALSVSAEVYSQNGLVSLKMKDVSLVKVFNEITKQTGYDFLYNYDLVQNKGTVDVNAKMVDLKDFLHDLLKGKNLGFEFRDGAIIVRGESVRLDDQKIKSRTIIAPSRNSNPKFFPFNKSCKKSFKSTIFALTSTVPLFCTKS